MTDVDMQDNTVKTEQPEVAEVKAEVTEAKGPAPEIDATTNAAASGMTDVDMQDNTVKTEQPEVAEVKAEVTEAKGPAPEIDATTNAAASGMTDVDMQDNIVKTEHPEVTEAKGPAPEIDATTNAAASGMTDVDMQDNIVKTEHPEVTEAKGPAPEIDATTNAAASGMTDVDMQDNIVKTEHPEVTEAKGPAPEIDATTNAAASTCVSKDAFKRFIAAGMKVPVVEALMSIFDAGYLVDDDVDERAIEMLNSFPENHSKYICKELLESELYGVQNKAQYIMSIMRNFRDRVRASGAAVVLSGKLIVGPELTKLKEIVGRTGYQLEITVGQRKYGGPPPEWDGLPTGPTGPGHECYVGHIPNDMYEDALIPLFEEIGKIWDLRLMMDPLNAKNRGYAFVTFCEKAHASEAAKKYDGHEIQTGKSLKVNVSVANTRLFIGNIPKSKSKDEILEELKKHAEGVLDAIVHTVPDATDRHKNRGFCFVDFADHKTASDAKRRIQQHKVRPFNADLVVDWAESLDEPDDDTMSKVKVLYVRNLKEVVSEEKLKEMFETYGEIERVKKVKDYGFVHFKEREPCMKAMEEMNGKEVEGIAIDCSLAKPQVEGKRKKPPMRRGGPGFSGQGAGYGSPGGGRGRRSGGPNKYPNQGYDDGYYGGGGGWGWGADAYGGSGYGGGYGDMGGYGGVYGGGYGYGMGGDGGYGGGYGGAPVAVSTKAKNEFPGVPGNYFQFPLTEFPQIGGYGNGGGWGAGRGGPQGGGGFRGGRGVAGGRGRGKRPGDRVGGPASKRDNGREFSADINMSSF